MAVNPGDLADPVGAITQYAGAGLFRVVLNLTKSDIQRRMRAGDEGTELPPLVPPRDDSEFPDEYPDFPELSDEPGSPRIGESIGQNASPGITMPADLFEGVVGLEDEKAVLKQVITSRNPLHALLIGPPGSGKSLLLEECRRMEGARYMVPRQLTTKGLRDVLLERPTLVLIEEVGTGDGAFQGMLLTAMDGLVTKDLVGQHEEITDLDTRFIATANSTENIIEPLLDRFWELHVEDYNPEQRRAAIIGYLTRKKELSPEIANEVAGLMPPHAGIRSAGQIGEVWRTNPELAKQMAAKLNARDPSPFRQLHRRPVNSRSEQPNKPPTPIPPKPNRPPRARVRVPHVPEKVRDKAPV